MLMEAPVGSGVGVSVLGSGVGVGVAGALLSGALGTADTVGAAVFSLVLEQAVAVSSTAMAAA
jgi:hypothetical protein